MDLRYDGSDGGTPDLELVDRTTSIGERHFGYLCTLLVWHEDLVDDAERRRNGVILRGSATAIRSSIIPSGCRTFGAVGAGERMLPLVRGTVEGRRQSDTKKPLR
jgi:hypothetical protein